MGFTISTDNVESLVTDELTALRQRDKESPTHREREKERKRERNPSHSHACSILSAGRLQSHHVLS
jgi:hypothetical protein